MAPRFVLPLLPLLSALSGLMSAQTPADSALAADSARLLFQQAFSAYQEGSAPALTRALQLWNRSLTHFRRARHRAEEGAALTWIGGLHDALGRPDSALAYYGRALVTLREVGDLRGEGLTLSGVGGVYGDLGQPDSALAYHKWALGVLWAVGDRRGEGVWRSMTWAACTPRSGGRTRRWS